MNGTTPSFSTYLSEGLHTITLTVTGDPSGISEEETVYLLVEAPEQPGGPFDSFWEQLALVLILVFILVTMLLQRFRIKEWEI